MVRADPQSPSWAWMALRLKMPKRFTFGSGGRRLPAHPDLSLRDYKDTLFLRHPTLTPILPDEQVGIHYTHFIYEGNQSSEKGTC